LSAISKATYQALSIGVSVAGGLVAGAIFSQIWKWVGGEDEAPDPKDLTTSTREVMTAAALQGLIIGVVRAAMNRAAARGYAAVTNENLD
jgi:Protein of unknown function (DUF4235)